MPHRHSQATQRSIGHQTPALLQCANHLGSKLSTHAVKGGINALPCRHPAGGATCCQALLRWLCSMQSNVNRTVRCKAPLLCCCQWKGASKQALLNQLS